MVGGLQLCQVTKLFSVYKVVMWTSLTLNLWANHADEDGGVHQSDKVSQQWIRWSHFYLSEIRPHSEQSESCHFEAYFGGGITEYIHLLRQYRPDCTHLEQEIHWFMYILNSKLYGNVADTG